MRTTLTDDETKLCKQIGKQYPAFGELLERMRASELEFMAAGTPEHFGTYKGRVSMLADLRQLVRS
jgi:hypothetical protein